MCVTRNQNALESFGAHQLSFVPPQKKNMNYNNSLPQAIIKKIHSISQLIMTDIVAMLSIPVIRLFPPCNPIRFVNLI